MTAKILTETRHHPLGKTCHHYRVRSMTCDLYDDMLDRAGRACEICRTPEAQTRRGRLVIDHDHTRGHIRGLLCGRCNSLMARIDGSMPWGNNPGEWSSDPVLIARARVYVANSWQMPDGSIRPRLHVPEFFEQSANPFSARLVLA